MEQQGDTAVEPPEPEVAPVRRGGVRLWALRVFVLTLLLAAAATVTAAAVTIVRDKGGTADPRRPDVYGVLMPDPTEYRQIVQGLLTRKHPLLLKGLTVVGDDGKVTLLHAERETATTFPSAYLNPGALSLIARAVGLRSDVDITVRELRLEKLSATGRLRWRLRGEQAGRPWRAVIAPNGTALKLLPAKTT